MAKKLSPMMSFYLDLKENYKDAIVLFRLGDFYEMFFDDAIKASRILDITLTGRDCGLEKRAPMCGVPYHAVDSYIAKETDSYKQTIADKNMRISELLHLNNNLNKQLDEYKMREDNVNKALITAIEKAQEMEMLVKKSYNIELERLRIWRDKWNSYAEKCKGIVGFNSLKGEVIGVLSVLENELIERIDKGIALNTKAGLNEAEEQYSKEVARIQSKQNKANEDLIATDEEIERILSNPDFNNLIKSLGIA